jgi:hypothetical protein
MGSGACWLPRSRWTPHTAAQRVAVRCGTRDPHGLHGLHGTTATRHHIAEPWASRPVSNEEQDLNGPPRLWIGVPQIQIRC